MNLKSSMRFALYYANWRRAAICWFYLHLRSTIKSTARLFEIALYASERIMIFPLYYSIILILSVLILSSINQRFHGGNMKYCLWWLKYHSFGFTNIAEAIISPPIKQKCLRNYNDAIHARWGRVNKALFALIEASISRFLMKRIEGMLTLKVPSMRAVYCRPL